jgi:hypothetical protein
MVAAATFIIVVAVLYDINAALLTTYSCLAFPNPTQRNQRTNGTSIHVMLDHRIEVVDDGYCTLYGAGGKLLG